MNFLNGNGKILKEVAISHGEVDEQFVKEVERSDLDEHNIN